MRFFFFGSLRDHDILEVVIGRSFPRRPFPAGHLPDHRLERMAKETFPLLVAAPGAQAPGIVVEGLETADIERIHFFESVEYEPRLHTVELAAGGTLDCHLFAATPVAGVTGEYWHYDDWAARHKAKELREARLWMAFHGRVTAAEADRLWNEAVAGDRALEDLVAEVIGVSGAAPGRGGGGS
ncbi:MAG: gamma-glutamylcyclotransferase family protein [Kiloniellales bacterium]|nr:gamma-glutamylcyclotransferase family protein [Kiloniellales bacterium]